MFTDDRIREIAARRESPVVTSCYLDVDGRRHPRHADYEHQLDLLLRQARERAAALEPEAARSVDGDVERISGWVRSGFDRSRVRGLAFFSCSATGFFEVVQSSRPIRNEIVLNPTPHVRQLEALVHEFERFAVVLVDRQRARLFRVEQGELAEQTEVFDAVPRRHDAGGRSAPAIQRHTDELAHKHLKHAAEVTFEELRSQPVDHLILGGPSPVVTEFEGLLHPYVKERVAARLSIMVTAAPEEVRQAALEVETQVEREMERGLVSRLRDGVGADNGAVGGLSGTLKALVERRVDLLLVADGYEAPGWRCPSCQFIAARGRDCPVCDTPMDKVDDIVEEAMAAALVQKCRVQVVRDCPELDDLGHIGALLRF